MDLLLFVGGLALLTLSADRFVLGAARLSTALRVAPVIVGALVIGFGTSTPELVVTAIASLQGSQDLALGNVVGSNTANALLVVGAAALLRPVAVSVRTLRRELPLMVGAVTLLAVLTADRWLTLLEAVVLLLAGAGVIAVVVVAGISDRDVNDLAEDVAHFTRATRPQIARASLLALAGLLGTLAGAQALVTGATNLARELGVSEAVIGLTVVAIGTSLPELVTAVAASRRGEADLIVGNVLGSNVFNSLLVAGTAGVLDTTQLDPAFRLSLVVMLGSAALLALFLRTGHRVARREAGLLLTLFFVSTVATF